MVDQILGVRVDAVSNGEVVSRVIEWAGAGGGRYVCVANVHMVMEAYDIPDFKRVVNEADLVTPDGMPLVWMLRRMGRRDQERVYGPRLTLDVLEAAQKKHLSVGFLGSTP